MPEKKRIPAGKESFFGIDTLPVTAGFCHAMCTEVVRKVCSDNRDPELSPLDTLFLDSLNSANRAAGKKAIRGGFRHVSKAPEPAIRSFTYSALTGAARISSVPPSDLHVPEELAGAAAMKMFTLTDLVWSMWQRTHRDLREAVSEFLSGGEEPLRHPREHVPIASCSVEMLDRAAADFRESFGESWSEDEVRVMICLVSATLPVPSGRVVLPRASGERTHSAGGDSGQPQPNRSGAQTGSADEVKSVQKEVAELPGMLSEFREKLHTLPPDAREWAAVESFVDELRKLREDANARLASDKDRSRLLETHKAIAGKHGSALEAYGLNWNGVDPDAVPATDVELLISVFNELDESLDNWGSTQATLGRLTPADRSAMRAGMAELDRLADTIEAICGELLDRFPSSSVRAQDKAEPKERPASGPDQEEQSGSPTAGESGALTLLESLEEVVAAPAGESETGDDLPLQLEPPRVKAPVGGGQAVESDSGDPEHSAAKEYEDRVESSEGVREQAEAEERTTQAGVSTRLRAAVRGESENGEPEIPETQAAFWSCMRDGDFAGAYWIARGCPDIEDLPAWIPALLQAGMWLDPAKPRFSDDLRAIAEQIPDRLDAWQAMLGQVGAMIPALVDHASGLHRLLDQPKLPNEFAGLFEAVNGLIRTNAELRPEVLASIMGLRRTDWDLKEISADAKDLLTKERGYSLHVMNRIWPRFRKEYLDPMLEPVVADNRDARATVKTMVERLERTDPDKLLLQIARDVQGNKARKIVSHQRDRFVEDWDLALRVAREWLESTKRRAEVESSAGFIQQSMLRLRDEVAKAVARKTDEVRKQTRSVDLVVTCQNEVLLTVVRQLASILGVPRTDFKIREKAVVRSVRRLTEDDDSLEIALMKRLLWLPEMRLSDARSVSPEEAESVACMLCDTLKLESSIPELASAWLQQGDFRFLRDLLALLPEEDPDRTRIEKELNEAIQASRTESERRCAELRTELEQAVVDGLIREDQRGEIEPLILRLEKETTLWLTPHLARGIADTAQARIHALSAEMTGVLSDRFRAIDSARVPASRIDQYERLHRRIEKQLAQEDFRAVSESLDFLERLAAGEELEIDSEDQDSAGEILEQIRRFVELRPKLVEYCREGAGALRTRLRNGDLEQHFETRLEGEQRKRLDSVLGAISDLTLAVVSKRSPDPRNFHEILTFCGLQVVESPGAVERTDKHTTHRPQASVRLAGTPDARIPRFGSASGQRYFVTVFNKPQTVPELTEFSRRSPLEGRAQVFLHTCAVSDQSARQVAHWAASEAKDVALVDLCTVLYIGLNQNQSSLFFPSSLIWTGGNPFSDSSAGHVAPELFAGRARLLSALARLDGPGVVYGGRQLGKSALLREVLRRFNNPGDHQHAVYVDIRSVGKPETAVGADQVWSYIRDALVKAGVLPAKGGQAGKRHRVEKELTDLFNGDGRLELLLLLDEADSFLDADARKGFQELTALGELMLPLDGIRRRFKVVFAGLNKVERFRGINNDKTPHFGESLLVGPLEPAAAARLIRVPCAAIGIDVERDAVLHILSYTNYHPALIQLFCRQLVESVLKKSGRATQRPVKITRNEIDDLYRNQRAIRDGIRSKFELTLALDPHYQAVAWAMIFEQGSDRAGFRREFSTNDIMQHVREHWPDAFHGDRNELAGILESMVGLGVLAVKDGAYRLRSPNLVSLMGGEDEVLAGLDSLKERKLPLPFDPGSIHRVRFHASESGVAAFSPFTLEQERWLRPDDWGITVVAATQAHGFGQNGVELFRELAGTECMFRELDSRLNTGQALTSALGKVVAEGREAGEPVLAVLKLDLVDRRTEALLDAARTFIRRRTATSERTRLRLVIVVDGEGLYAGIELGLLLTTDPDIRLVVPSAIRMSGIGAVLAAQEFSDRNEILKPLTEAAGAWHLFVDDLIRRVYGRGNKSGDPEQIGAWLGARGQPGDELTTRFRRTLGLDRPELLRFLNLVADAVPPLSEDQLGDDAELEMVAEFCGLSPDQCTILRDYCLILGLVRSESDGLVVDSVVSRVAAIPAAG